MYACAVCMYVYMYVLMYVCMYVCKHACITETYLFVFQLTFRPNGTTHNGAGRSSEVERSRMVRWVVGSILHGVDPLTYFSFQPVPHDWFIKGRGMYYPVCGMVHIK